MFMAYSFKGFFSTASDINRSALPDRCVFRNVTEPFKGCGILAPSMPPVFDECEDFLRMLGISENDWLFLDYETWAGPVDYVLAFGRRSNIRFGPIEADGDAAEDAFYQALSEFGLGEDIGVIFPPFERGFFGEFDHL
ncbi:MAG: hypothetical protein GQ535_16865 [Rhodobacteraceae bacterium]|nr:hypothetical protein [Paracoccaceae bacterium]